MTKNLSPNLSLRIDLGSGQRFGPGKAALLRAIREHASIAAAASALGMSYPRALKLIDQMNASFTAPLVSTQHGGSKGGGADVTETGQAILALYEQICETAQAAGFEHLRALSEYLISE